MFKGPIVIVDDDTEDQALIREAAEKAEPRITVRVFNDGNEVYNYLALGKENPFLILCDIRMPKMGGLTLREKIDKDERLRRKAIPFVYLTGSATTADVLEAYKLSVQGFFTKPNRVEEWERLLKVILTYWNDCIHPNSLSKTVQ